MGSTMGTDAEFDVIAARFASGVLRPPVDSTWTMAQGREAYARLQSGAQFGKVVVLIDG